MDTVPRPMIIITARRSYASAVLGVVILSVCPSVCHTRALSLIHLPAIFLYHILITTNIQSDTGFPSSHQLKSYMYVASKSRLKLAERCPVSGCWPSCNHPNNTMSNLWLSKNKTTNNLWNVVVSCKNQCIYKVMSSITTWFKNRNLKIQNSKQAINYTLISHFKRQQLFKLLHIFTSNGKRCTIHLSKVCHLLENTLRYPVSLS